MLWRDHTAVSGEVVTLDDAFGEGDLEQMRRIIEEAGERGRPFNLLTSFVNGKKADTTISSMLYERLRGALVPYRDRCGIEWEPLRASEYIMYADITAGQQFGMHTDTGTVWDERAMEFSKFTLLIILNEGFDGGDTVFYDAEYSHLCDVKHAKGRILLFDIDLPHVGATVTRGRKTWLGTELVYRRKAGPPPTT